MPDAAEIKLSHYKQRVAQYEETIADLKVQIALLQTPEETPPEGPRRSAGAAGSR